MRLSFPRVSPEHRRRCVLSFSRISRFARARAIDIARRAIRRCERAARLAGATVRGGYRVAIGRGGGWLERSPSVGRTSWQRRSRLEDRRHPSTAEGSSSSLPPPRSLVACVSLSFSLALSGESDYLRSFDRARSRSTHRRPSSFSRDACQLIIVVKCPPRAHDSRD